MTPRCDMFDRLTDDQLKAELKRLMDLQRHVSSTWAKANRELKRRKKAQRGKSDEHPKAHISSRLQVRAD